MIFKGKFEGLSWEKTAFGQYSTWLELERYLNQHSFILNTATHISHNRLAYGWYLCALGISTQELSYCCRLILPFLNQLVSCPVQVRQFTSGITNASPHVSSDHL